MEIENNGSLVHKYRGKKSSIFEANFPAFVPAVTFACVAMRHDVFDRFKLNEKYIEEAQDTDMCLRMQKAGFKILYNPKVEIYHLECSSRDWRRGEVDRELFKSQWLNAIKKIKNLGEQRKKFFQNEYQDAIVIIRDDGIGDLLMGISAFKSLREQNPNKKLVLLTYERNMEMMNGQLVLMTKDHIHPVSCGGKDHLSNYQVCCHICNNLKGNLPLKIGEIAELRRVHREKSKVMGKKRLSALLEYLRQEFVANRAERPVEIVDLSSGYNLCQDISIVMANGNPKCVFMREALAGEFQQIASLRVGMALEPIVITEDFVEIKFNDDTLKVPRWAIT
jgi:hypothetical protein